MVEQCKLHKKAEIKIDKYNLISKNKTDLKMKDI